MLKATTYSTELNKSAELGGKFNFILRPFFGSDTSGSTLRLSSVFETDSFASGQESSFDKSIFNSSYESD